MRDYAHPKQLFVRKRNQLGGYRTWSAVRVFLKFTPVLHTAELWAESLTVSHRAMALQTNFGADPIYLKLIDQIIITTKVRHGVRYIFPKPYHSRSYRWNEGFVFARGHLDLPASAKCNCGGEFPVMYLHARALNKCAHAWSDELTPIWTK